MIDEEYLPEDDREIRASLGLESAYGYYVERPLPLDEHDPGAWDIVAIVAVATATEGPEGLLNRPARPYPLLQRLARAEGEKDETPPRYPCLDGARYSGCVGAACPLKVCWTGTYTPAYQAHLPRVEPTGSVAYLGDILCHRCRHVVDAPAWGDAPRRPRPHGLKEVTTLRKVTCARDKWRHAVSARSFATRHIPLKDDVEPLACPAFEDAGTLHPEVIAERDRHRQAMRAYREHLKRDQE